MHELSIAYSVVEIASQSAKEAGATRILAVRLLLGTLAGVDRSALEFCYDVATADTLLAGSVLLVTEVMAEIYCPGCSCVVELENIQSLRCPKCGETSCDLRRGRELEIESIEIETPNAEDL